MAEDSSTALGMTGGRAACKFCNALYGDARLKSGVGVLAKAVADRTAQELISGRGLNSAAARGEPNLPGKLRFRAPHLIPILKVILP